jgi:hypothetical protein
MTWKRRPSDQEIAWMTRETSTDATKTTESMSDAEREEPQRRRRRTWMGWNEVVTPSERGLWRMILRLERKILRRRRRSHPLPLAGASLQNTSHTLQSRRRLSVFAAE